MDAATNTKLLRLRWELAWNHEDNWKGIQTISDYIKKHGASHVPEAAANIHDISQKDLELRVIQKFKDIVSALKNTKLFDGHGSIPQRVETVTEGDVEGVTGGNAVIGGAAVVVKPKEGLSKAQIQSRAKGVSNLCSLEDVVHADVSVRNAKSELGNRTHYQVQTNGDN